MGHFIHAFKKNVSILYVVMNNETYGLTKGQASPTSRIGFEGNVEQPFDAILTALSIPAPNFIARTFSGDPRTMTAVLVEALKFNQANRGFAFVEDLSPCVTYNDTFKEWREKVVDISKLPGYDPTDRKAIFRICLETMDSGKIPIGVMHRPREDDGKQNALELKLLPDLVGPVGRRHRTREQHPRVRPASERPLLGARGDIGHHGRRTRRLGGAGDHGASPGPGGRPGRLDLRDARRLRRRQPRTPGTDPNGSTLRAAMDGNFAPLVDSLPINATEQATILSAISLQESGLVGSLLFGNRDGTVEANEVTMFETLIQDAGTAFSSTGISSANFSLTGLVALELDGSAATSTKLGGVAFTGAVGPVSSGGARRRRRDHRPRVPIVRHLAHADAGDERHRPRSRSLPVRAEHRRESDVPDRDLGDRVHRLHVDLHGIGYLGMVRPVDRGDVQPRQLTYDLGELRPRLPDRRRRRDRGAGGGRGGPPHLPPAPAAPTTSFGHVHSVPLTVMWLGVDDTDGPSGGCTTFVLTEIVDAAQHLGFDLIGDPRLVRLNPNVPWKTRGNGALAARFGHGRGRRRKVGEIAGRPVGVTRGADPWAPPNVDDFSKPPGRRCSRPARPTRGATRPLSPRTNRFGRPFTARPFRRWCPFRTRPRCCGTPRAQVRTDGSRRGIVGAGAALSWPGRTSTWELLAYRGPNRVGSRREVDPEQRPPGG